jgi:hypothetical protein
MKLTSTPPANPVQKRFCPPPLADEGGVGTIRAFGTLGTNELLEAKTHDS